MKMICDFMLFIHFYSADLNDFKGEKMLLFFFSLRTLVPFQIQNNVVHTVSSGGSQTAVFLFLLPHFILNVQYTQFSRKIQVSAGKRSASAICTDYQDISVNLTTEREEEKLSGHLSQGFEKKFVYFLHGGNGECLVCWVHLKRTGKTCENKNIQEERVWQVYHWSILRRYTPTGLKL